jgi:hypothetical protein
MRRVQKNAVLVLQHLTELVDDFVTFASEILKLWRSRLCTKFLSQRCHDCYECVVGLSENPFAKFHPGIYFVAWSSNLAFEAIEGKKGSKFKIL